MLCNIYIWARFERCQSRLSIYFNLIIYYHSSRAVHKEHTAVRHTGDTTKPTTQEPAQRPAALCLSLYVLGCFLFFLLLALGRPILASSVCSLPFPLLLALSLVLVLLGLLDLLLRSCLSGGHAVDCRSCGLGRRSRASWLSRLCGTVLQAGTLGVSYKAEPQVCSSGLVSWTMSNKAQWTSPYQAVLYVA